MNKYKDQKKEKYNWSKILLFLVCLAMFFWFISGVDEQKPPHPDSLVMYQGEIKGFIEETGKYSSTCFVDIETKEGIKRLWFVPPITRFWGELKCNYPDGYLTVYGRPYGAKRVHVWELHVGNRILFTYNDRIKMGSKQTTLYRSLSLKAMIIFLVSLCVVFPYERKLYNSNMA
jgi:hypothetical protein